MPDDPRDFRTRKTPPPHVRAQTGSSGIPDEEISGDSTPVTADPFVRLEHRSRRTQRDVSDLIPRIAHIEQRLHAGEQAMAELRERAAATETTVIGLDAKLDVLVTEAKAAATERGEREKRAELRAEAELNRRSERARAIIAIIVPTIIALGGLIAAIVAAYNSSGAK